jgi:hypothetical protein
VIKKRKIETGDLLEEVKDAFLVFLYIFPKISISSGVEEVWSNLLSGLDFAKIKKNIFYPQFPYSLPSLLKELYHRSALSALQHK